MMNDLLPASGTPLISMAPPALEKRRVRGTGGTGSGKGDILGKRGTDVKNRLSDSVGEGEGGMIRQKSVETCILPYVK